MLYVVYGRVSDREKGRRFVGWVGRRRLTTCPIVSFPLLPARPAIWRSWEGWSLMVTLPGEGRWVGGWLGGWLK